MSRLFISHSSRNDDWAIALQAWLIREGWSGEDDIFLDLDPERGIVAGQRWVRALEDAATRCEAVLFLVSEAWLASKWCGDEYQLANKLNKKLFALLIDDIPLERLPGGLTAQWQVVHLKGEPAERFLTVHPRTQHQSPVHIAEAGLKSLKRGLEKAGIGAETFELQPDANGPFGWRAPYRGLEALEPEDAAVFFGRSADIVRGIDALRGLAARKPPRLLVILGASGAGKSSFLRAGLWPRLGATTASGCRCGRSAPAAAARIEGSEGLLAALEDVHRRFALRTTRADLRERAGDAGAVRRAAARAAQAAARRALISDATLSAAGAVPRPGRGAVRRRCRPRERNSCFGSRAPPSTRTRRCCWSPSARMPMASCRAQRTLAGIDQVPLSLGPVPQGEIARIIREPSEVLRRKAGPSAPVFDAAVVERLQSRDRGRDGRAAAARLRAAAADARARGAGTIGLEGARADRRRGGGDRTGGGGRARRCRLRARSRRAARGAAAAVHSAARPHRPREQGAAAPRRAPERPARPICCRSPARSPQRRLLVAKLAGEAERGEAGPATLEVAHEALLRRWPTLADLLAEDRDALLLLDGVLLAAADWDKAEADASRIFSPIAARGWRTRRRSRRAGRTGSARSHRRAPISPPARRAKRPSARRRRRRSRASRRGSPRSRRRRRGPRACSGAPRGRWRLAAWSLLGLGAWHLATMRRANPRRADSRLDREAERQSQAEPGRRRAGRLKPADRDRRAGERGQVSMLAKRRPRLSSGRQANRPAALACHSDTAAASAIVTSRLRLRRLQHAGPEPRRSSAPTGRASSRRQRTDRARVWDAATGKEIAVLRGHERIVHSAAFSPDGVAHRHGVRGRDRAHLGRRERQAKSRCCAGHDGV